MENFCGSAFWDTNLTWYTTNPYFTPCFESSILTISPLVFVLLFGFIDILNASKSSNRKESLLSNFFPLMTLKCCSTSFLLVLQLAQIITFQVKLDKITTQFFTIDYLAPASLILGYVIILILSVLTHNRKVASSGVQFFFWLLATLTQAILFRTACQKYYNDDDKQGIVYLIRFISFPVTAFRFILEWFDDNAFKRHNFHLQLEKLNPEISSTFIRKLLVLWFDKFAWTGYRRTLNKEDLYNLNHGDTSSSQYKKFSKYYKTEEDKTVKENLHDTKESVSLRGIFIPLCKTYGLTYVFSIVLNMISDLLAFVQPTMLGFLVSHVRNPDLEPTWKGFLYVGIICVTVMTQTLLNVSSGKRAILTGIRVRTALTSAVFRKALVISTASKKQSSLGETVNLMSVDSQRMLELLPVLNVAFGGILQLIFATYYLYQILGYSLFVGMAVLIFLIPLNAVVVALIRKYQVEQMKLKDERVKLISEVLCGMKVLKLHSWETAYKAQIDEIRQKEIVYIRKIAIVNSISGAFFGSSALLISLASFTTFVLSDTNNVFSPEIAFVSMNLFDILRIPFILFPVTVSSAIQASVSVSRLNKYLNMEEIDKSAVTHDESYEDPIMIEDGSFSWTSEKISLKNINLSVKQGELVAVVGAIGSGKTTLLSTMLGDLTKHSGTVNIKGNLAYVSQSAWVQNATVRENILFGDKLNLRRYNKTIAACALETDLQILAEGDQTEIGEKGTNLSGGQKQRIALARAGYKDASIYLFDDPLSGVDSQVGKHIFEKLIGPTGMLKDKTRILVTHAVNFLPHVDKIIVMKNGQISEIGTYKELLYQKGEFAELLLQHVGIKSEEDIASEDNFLLHDLEEVVGVEVVQHRTSLNRENIMKERKSVVSAHLQESVHKKLVLEEESAEGRIKLSVFMKYFKPARVLVIVAALILVPLSNGLNAFGDIWISNWSAQASIDKNETGISKQETTNQYVLGYGLIIATQILVSIFGAFALIDIFFAAARSLHTEALTHIMRAPMSYFDSTLIGRITNRFSKDIDILDNVVPWTVRAVLFLFFNVISIVIIISYSLPQFIGFIVPVGIFYFFIQRFYVSTTTQLKRLDGVTRSPIYSHFGETLSATSTVRAFQSEDDFIIESEKRVDMNIRSYLTFLYSTLWIAIRLEIVGMFIILSICTLVLLARESINPVLAALVISYSFQITTFLNILTRGVSNLEANVVSVERVTELSKIPQEPEWENIETKPSPSWPEHGNLKFDNYATRYREDFDFVLKGISFTIKTGEKIGLVGRTGAGKSSLSMALFRIIESAGGKILIDGVDISTLGLHDLRKNLTIIPQDPVLFSVSLRVNLDPYNEYSDEQIWKCLELAHLKVHVAALNGGLQHKVEEEAQNFSVGQRQLICLARALLRKTRILVLDEATAAVDFETEDLIQTTICNEFADSTVITIAHRLNTIMDSDRVMVLDNGEVKEFDTPESLLENENSIFWRMARDAKLV